MKQRYLMKKMIVLGLVGWFWVFGRSIIVNASEQEPEGTVQEEMLTESEVVEEVENETEVHENIPVLLDDNLIEEQTIQESQEVVELKSAKVTIEKQSYEDGTATIKVDGMENVTAGVKEVLVAVWSQENQKDLNWYTAQYKNDGWYVDMDIDKYHKNNWSTYIVHVYATDGNGMKKYVGGTHIDFSFETIRLNIDWNIEKMKATVSIGKDELKTPGTVKAIQCAIWTETNGQDDLKWYDFQYNIRTSKWTVTIPLTQLKSIGHCMIHTYLTKTDGTKVFVGGSSHILEKPSVKSVDVKTVNTDGTFSVTLRGIYAPLGCKEVKVAVWSQGNQSDLVWYSAKKNSNETYTFSSDILKHQYNIGTYYVHAYITDELGINTCVKCSTMEFSKKVGNMKAEAIDNQEAYYTIKLPVETYPVGLKLVEFGVWSNHNGQDDLKWYVADCVKNENGYLYTCKVDISNHKTNGSYSVHGYGTDKTGKKVFLIGHGALFQISGTTNANLQITGKNETAGTFEVNITDVKSSTGIDQIKLAVWTQNNQSDLYWYTCTKQSNGSWTALVDIAKHDYNSGNYIMHAYAVLNNKIQTYACGKSYKFETRNFTYVKKDLGEGKRIIGIVNPTSTTDLKVAVWSKVDGQDDLCWYKAEKIKNGKWQVIVNADNHEGSGLFYAHIYSESGMLMENNFTFEESECVEKYFWPCPSSARITSYFGYRSQPTSGASTYHQGIDIGATSGAAIVATRSGIVTACSYTSVRGYYVEIMHDDGVKSLYMHMSKQAVSTGTRVTKGQTIGYVGSTGVSTGPHLHFSIVVNGINVNPLDYVTT